MITVIFGSWARSVLAGTSTDFLSDRLNHMWTVLAFCVFAFIVGIQEYVGDPIHCWCPAQFTDSHCNYTEAYCWVHENYIIPMDEPIPVDYQDRYDIKIKYYPWVPMILMFLAFCFKVPNVIWNLSNGASGVGIKKIMRIINEATLSNDNNNLKHVADYLNNWIFYTRKNEKSKFYKLIVTLSSLMCFCFGPHNSSYITGLYVFIKFVYFGVAFGLFFVLNRMLAFENTLYGLELIDALGKGEETLESPYFPRMTLCDFKVRQLQNIHTYSVQCILSVNLFSEKIFIIVWFLLIFMSIANGIAWIMALKNFSWPRSRKDWLKSRIKTVKRMKETKELNEKKLLSHLGSDGIFILRLIEDNTNEVTSSDIIHKMNESYLERLSL